MVALTGCAPLVLSLPASWAEYVAALPAAQADAVRLALGAFDRWTGGHADLRVARTARELVAGIAVLRALQGADPLVGEHEQMLELFRRGVLELMWLTAHREPVAALLSVVWGDTAVVHLGAHRTGLPDGVRVDLVIQALAVRRAIERGRRAIEFRQRSRFQ